MCGGEAAPARGQLAEEIASAFLRLQGVMILDRNRRAGGGEIDLIARHGRTLVFVEVRLRVATAWVGAAASIDARKRMRLRRAARTLAREEAFRWPGRDLRFDAVTVRCSGQRLEVDWLRQLRI